MTAEPVDLNLSMYGVWDANDNRHAQAIMADLGVKYLFGVPQSLFDSWWFLGCTNVPATLPEFIIVMPVLDPDEFVGHGLSQEKADQLKAYRLNA